MRFQKGQSGNPVGINNSKNIMEKGEKRPGAGRPKGSKNKANAARESERRPVRIEGSSKMSTANSERTVKRHPNLKPFKKGQSGNPSGRPAIVKEVQELARENTEEAMNTLVSICKGRKQPAAARVAAAGVILDRGWGKAPATLTVNRNRDVSELSTDELLAIIHAGEDKPLPGDLH